MKCGRCGEYKIDGICRSGMCSPILNNDSQIDMTQVKLDRIIALLEQILTASKNTTSAVQNGK